MTSATMVQAQAQGLRDTARWADDRVARYGTTARTLSGDARVLAGAWVSPLATQLVGDVERRTARLHRSASAFQDVATVLARSAAQGEEISARLASLEAREQEITTALGRLGQGGPSASMESETLRHDLATTRRDLEAARDSWDDESRRTADHLNSATEAVSRAAAEDESDGPSVLDRLGTVTGAVLENPLLRGSAHAWNSFSAAANTTSTLRWFDTWFDQRVIRMLTPLRALAAGMAAASPRLNETPGRPWRDVTPAIRAGREGAAAERRLAAREIEAHGRTARQAQDALNPFSANQASQLGRVGGRFLMGASILADGHTVVNGSQYEGGRGQMDEAMAYVGLGSVGALGVAVLAPVAAPVLAPVAVVAGVGAAAWGVGNFVADSVDWDRARETAAGAVTTVASGVQNVATNTGTVIANAGGSAASGLRSVGRRLGFGG